VLTVSPTLLAFLGLFFWVWSHEMLHAYERNGHQWVLTAALGTSGLAMLLLLLAAYGAVTG
jgi:integral membrane sensor domain MASE1